MSESIDPDIYPAHAMYCDDGTLFYPDDEGDARWFADVHDALPVWPQVFPFDIAEPVLRARVTMTVEVWSKHPLAVTDNYLWSDVAERVGRAVDGRSYTIRTSPYGETPEQYEEFTLGTIHDGPVEWADGSAPESGWHCDNCRQPKRDAGPCHGNVLLRGAVLPCSDDDADHHGSCWHRPPQRGVKTGGVA